MIILAVIIIIALIVVGVMGGIPGLGGGARKRAGASYWQTAEVGIVAYEFTEVGFYIDENTSLDTGTLRVRNNLRDTITLTAIGLDGIGGYSTSTIFKPGETKSISISVTNNSNWNPCAAASARYTLDVEINYTDDETGASYVFSGEGNKLEGVCAA